jgi:tRNA(Arg) A34 adenosine deaminase TadA
MSITNAALANATTKDGTWRHLLNLLADDKKKVAFFESKTERNQLYYAWGSEAAPCTPVAKLYLSGVYIWTMGDAFRNYAISAADEGTQALCGGPNFERKESTDLKKMLNGSFYDRWRVNQVTVSDLPDLLRGDFSHYDAQGPGVDVTRENPSGPNAHDGFHTMHRLYMAAAYRILRAKQNPGGREGVAAILVNSTGKILSWGVKNPAHPALHGETSALLGYGGNLPAGVRMYTTLKPCKMCAGWITTLTGGGHRVYYGQDDPTSAAEDTDLDRSRTSALLSGRRHVAGVRGIVPLSSTGGKYNITLAEMLDQDYRHVGQSIIDFASGNTAREDYTRSNRMLEAKIRKYADTQRTGKNRIVWAVLSYLTGFLNHIGVVTDGLQPPPT